jgi:hypothetical protein
LLVGVRTFFKIAQASDLRFGCVFLLRGDSVRANGVFGFAQYRDADGNQFFVGTF